jgi:hypothetical protein
MRPKQTTRVRGILTASDQNLVRPILVPQLRCITLSRLELYCDLSVVEQVGPLEDNAEAALADLLANAVVHADNIAAAGGHGGYECSGWWMRREGVRCEEARLDEWCRSGSVREKGAGRALPPLLAW